MITNQIGYIYDGMMVIQERDINNNPTATYTRGLDLSMTRQGAGGIGGLLARNDSNGPAFYHADANGNITALLDTNQFIAARYEYDPYGRLIGKWGRLADANRYRFSSKEYQPASGLYNYGYRFYEPNFSRWLNCDPIGERGGINLYRAMFNNALSWIDSFGLDNMYNVSAGQNAPPSMMITAPTQGGGAPTVSYQGGQGDPYLGLMAAQAAAGLASGAAIALLGLPADQAALVAATLAQAALDNPQQPGRRSCPAMGMAKPKLGIFGNAPKGFSNWNLADQTHSDFRDALNSLYGTQEEDWRMETDRGQTGVDATYIGPESRYPGFDYAELKPYSQNSLETLGNQLENWGLPSGQIELFLYNEGGIIGSSGFRF